MTRWIALVAVCVWCAVSAPARADQPHAQPRIIANVTAIEPGKTFLLGVQIAVAPGWHIYWKNPGVGLPTKVKFILPPGFEAGELRYPTPELIVQPGNIIANAYEKSVLLFAEVKAPEKLPAGFDGKFQAAVSWLVCSQECIPGRQTVSLSLPAGPASSANAELFKDCQAHLPKDVVEAEGVSKISSSGEMKPTANTYAGDFVIHVTWQDQPPEKIDFFPESMDNFNLTSSKIVTDANQSTITFSLETLVGKNVSPATLSAVVGYTNKEGARRGVKLSIPLLPREARNN